METIGQRIKSARKQAKFTQGDVAKRLGIGRVAVTNWETGATEPARERIADLAEMLGVPVDWLLTGRGADVPIPSMVVDVPNARITGHPSGGSSVVPVYGQAVAGVDGQFPINGNILFWVVAPPQIAKIEGAYAVSISGDSMSPRYEDGEIAFVDPTRRVRKGDYVVAQIQSDDSEVPQAYVKRFQRHNEEELVLDQFNPPKELKFDHDRVVSVHYIALAGSPDKE